MPRNRPLEPARSFRPGLRLPALVAVTYCLIGGAPSQVARAQLIKTAQVRSQQAAPSDAFTPASIESRQRVQPPPRLQRDERSEPALAEKRSAKPAARFAELTSARTPALDPEADLAELDAATLDAPPANALADTSAGGSVVLDGRTVACQAAACSPLAKMLEQRAATLLADAGHCSEAEQRSAAVQASFLRRQAARQRDIAAANALRAYYSWIANRDQLRLVSDGYELQREQVATQQALIERGVAIGDPTALERQRLELRDSEVQSLANDRRLTQTLLQLTCCSSDPRGVTVESLEIRSSTLACDPLVAFALEHRQDYLALVELCRCLDKQTARSIAAMLTPLTGGIGLQVLNLNCLEKLLLAAHGAEAVGQISRELQLAIDMERRLVEQSVCEKCLALSAAYERVDIAQQILATWHERIAMLNRLAELGEARGEELATARGAQLKARSGLLERELAAKLAEVDLAEAMGDLAQRCCRGEPWLITSN